MSKSMCGSDKPVRGTNENILNFSNNNQISSNDSNFIITNNNQTNSNELMPSMSVNSDQPLNKRKMNSSAHSVSSYSIKKEYQCLTPGGSEKLSYSKNTTSRPRLISQTSEESRKSARKHRIIHSAEQRRRAAQKAVSPHSRFLIPINDDESSNYRKAPNAFSALRRLSRGNFSSIKRAGKKMKNLQYQQIFSQFSRYTTIHGISHAALAPSSKWRRFWFVVFSICFVVLLIQISLLIVKYFTYPKSVDLDLKFENAPFPSVTICNLNPYKASAIEKDKSIKTTMDAFKNIMETTRRNEENAAALITAKKSKKKRKVRIAKGVNKTIITNNINNNTTTMSIKTFKNINYTERRYIQVYAQCYCKVNRLSGERKRESCYAAHEGKVSVPVNKNNVLANFHATKCLCQLDWIAKTVWPCFPYNTWKEYICTECNERLGHCPMRFYSKEKSIYDLSNICLCHKDYNHCVENNENGEIPELIPSLDLEQQNFTVFFSRKNPNSASLTLKKNTTTTQAPEITMAMGYEELTDEIALNAKARENLMFAVEEKPLKKRVQLSQTKDELILKCSFNQQDCDIKNDFTLYYDPTYGNCYTFNWNRTEAVTAHRAGANYGLRVLLYANISEYLPTTEAVGFRVTIHDKWVVPFPDAFGHTAPTGFMSSFGVRMKEFIRIEHPHGRCKPGGEEADTYIYKGYHYSVEGCHRSCTQNEIVRKCGCADPNFPTTAGVQHCAVSEPIARECIKNTTKYIGQLISTGQLENCNCHQPCKETGYEASYSSARWPSGTTKLLECENGDDLCVQKYRKNAAMIQVYYEELNHETLIESAAYGFSSLLADLGGVSGLWIGISVVSVVEVVQLLNFFLKAYFKRQKISLSSSQKTGKPRTIFYSNRSLNSSCSLYKTKKESLPSLKSGKSYAMDDNINIINEEISSSRESTPIRKNTFLYLPPDAELPCTCLYGSKGNIVFMKPLCPFHGFMVRRNTIFTEYSHGNDEELSDNASYNVESITQEEKNILEKIHQQEKNYQNKLAIDKKNYRTSTASKSKENDE